MKHFVAHLGCVLALCFLTVACSDDPQSPNPQANEPSIRFIAERFYTTPSDTIEIVAEVRDCTEVRCFFGDGTDVRLPLAGDSVRIRHVYDRKGVFGVRISGLNDGAESCADTAEVHVLDYVHPSEATTVTVTISGIKLFYTFVVANDSLNDDSTWIAVENDYGHTFIRRTGIPPSPAILPLPWNESNASKFYSKYYTDAQSWVTMNAEIQLSPDGASIARMQLGSCEFKGMDICASRDSDLVILENIELKADEPPSKNRAVYERRIEFLWSDSMLRIYLRKLIANHDFMNDTNPYNTLKYLYHFEPYTSVTIRVEFSK